LSEFPLKTRPTCPGLLIPYEGQLYGLPLQRLACAIEIHVATAFVKITAAWKNIAKYPSKCMFVLPLNGTVTQVQVQLQDKVIETVVVPNDKAGSKAAQQRQAKAGAAGAGGGGDDEQPEVNYVPNLFRLPVNNVTKSIHSLFSPLSSLLSSSPLFSLLSSLLSSLFLILSASPYSSLIVNMGFKGAIA